PLIFNDHVLANAANGKIYAIGTDRLFEVSPSVSGSDNEALYVSGSALNGSPRVKKIRVHSNGKTYDEPVIVTSDSNGSLFLFTTAGKLLFNANMGQPAKPSFSPFIADINKNSIPNILTLGRYGRLF